MSQLGDQFLQDNQHIPLTIQNNNFVKPNNQIFHRVNPQHHQNQNRESLRNKQFKSLNALSRNKIGKAVLSQQFQNFLIADQSNAQLNVVSMMGSKKIGTSFLTDCLISSAQGKTLRTMSKSNRNLINAHNNLISNKNDQKLVYLDCCGQMKEEQFLWCYFISSTIVYSMNFGDKQAENILMKYITYVKSYLQFDPDDLSLPQLIIAYRDGQPQQRKKSNPLLQKIQQYNLFDGDVIVTFLSFPGNSSCNAKQLPDIPQKAFNPNFQKQLKNLQGIIKMNKTKSFKSNYMTAKILSLTLEPLTKEVNKQRTLSATIIWDQVIETLSVGFYNYYIIQYSQRLQKQFEDEKPVDKYTLYKRLSAVKRSIDKKVDGFSNISGDPIFQRYKQKLKDTINTKQKMIKQINKVKAKNANSQLCKNLLGKINNKNYAQIIDQYCQKSFDDQRTQVLLQNFQKVIEQKLKQVSKSKQPVKKPSLQISNLENQIKKLQEQIERQKLVKSKPKQYDFQTVNKSIKAKEEQIDKLQQQLQEQFKANGGSQSRILNQQIDQLERQISQMKQKVKQQQDKVKKLKMEKQNKVKQVVDQLQKKRRFEQDKLNKLEQMLRKAKVSPQQAKQNAKKDSCCEVM